MTIPPLQIPPERSLHAGQKLPFNGTPPLKFQADTAQFGLPSRRYSVIKGDMTLNFRIWHQPGEAAPKIPKEAIPKGNDVMLILHGLSNRTEFLTPYAKSLLENQPNLTVVGLDVGDYGNSLHDPDAHPGKITLRTIKKVRTAIQTLSDVSDRKIFVSGISYGGLMSLLAAPINCVKGFIEISPALKPAKGTLPDGLHELTHGKLGHVKIMPEKPDGFMESLNTEQQAVQRAKEDQVKSPEIILSWPSKIKTLFLMQYTRYIRLLMPHVRETPLLSFATVRDGLVSPEAIAHFAKTYGPQARHIMYTDAEHDLTIDPVLHDHMAKTIHEWLNRQRAE